MGDAYYSGVPPIRSDATTTAHWLRRLRVDDTTTGHWLPVRRVDDVPLMRLFFSFSDDRIAIWKGEHSPSPALPLGKIM